MPIIARSALVAHSAAQMYQLVHDVEAYPEFLPWCDSASISEQSETHQLASLSIDRRMRGIKFTTRNRLEENEAIHMSLVDGPFRQLKGVWRFKAIDDDACKVELEMDFVFKSRIFGKLLEPAFSKICDSMVAAFVKRADHLKG